MYPACLRAAHRPASGRICGGLRPDFSAPADKVLISQTNYPIVNGLTESQVILNNASGSAQVLGYMATITPVLP